MATRDNIEDWLARTAQGDRAAFKLLYRDTSAKLFGLCLRILNDRAEAEDALQEVFVKVWHGAGSYRANGLSPMTWLIAVARNHAIDRLRRRQAAAGGMDEAAEIADARPGPEAQVMARAEAGRVVACLDELEGARAEAVRGAYLDGETYADLAERFSVPFNTMRTWLRRSLIKLRECLER
ncbi:sigma-70 family RNA polymerase sigma factor [Maritimibacter fusiformis]|uniref:Sigma-70 family RNA polymerase sigma factor n=1 Tax=Maritimibacter fusiformis TaxID=2603819 RepID=A0A5D0RML2_9RHOB|nr:sigma-70 family RNA polymerase sigma factor [Maritimibacter fusiformis]TYB82897.1 sigma-70 family RNA polymerase sigma factor [Maritimibacter fusiformis]